DAEGTGRQETVLFRRNFQLNGDADTAFISLFADSRYHLYVNGTHLNFGPSRFYPEAPQYDSYNLAPYLRQGENVVAVEVLSNGTVTFQVPLSRGGFIAWGEVRSPSGNISFETPGEWKMWVPGAYDTEALRFSFACGPMEIFDGRKQPPGWNRPGYDDSGWNEPVPHADQEYWGRPTPRSIPALTRDEVVPFELLGIYREKHSEQIYSFFIKTPDNTREEYGAGKQMYAATYIYSPGDQVVEAGLWWGEHYLNGEGPLKVSGEEPGNPVRQNRLLHLNKGWNFLFIGYVAIWGGWDFYLAVPSEAGLVLSPHRQLEDENFIVTAGPFEEGTRLFDPDRDLKKDPEILLSDKRYGWVPRVNPTRGRNPVRDLVWHSTDLGENLKKDDYRVSGFTVDEPLTMVVDMGGKQLGTIFLETDAAAGSMLDMGWAEDLNALGMPNLYKRVQVNSGARFITSQGNRRYETFKPYGVRYLVVRIDPGDQPCILQRIGMVSQIYPFDKKGSFSCSNPMLNRIWEMGWRTLRVCAEDSYTDTPFRERGLYAGDAVPEYGITLATSGDSRLMKRSLMLFQQMYREQLVEGKQEGLNDFVLKTLALLDWYAQVTGDLEFVAELYPHYRSLMVHLLNRRNEQGYFPTDRVFIEWTKIDKNSDLTAYQALVARSFSIMSRLAGELGKNMDAELFAREADDLSRIIRSLFWDESAGAFRDGFREGIPIEHHYPISSVYPMLFHLSREDQEQQILEMLDRELRDIGEESRNRKITPYGSFYLFAALYDQERADLAERFMLQYWSRMILQGDDTSWENFDIAGAGGGGQGTASHAWSGHPTYFLSTEVLGVKLGFSQPLDRREIVIAPQSATLSWARGRVPHPAGTVGVEWHIRGDHLVMEVTVPGGVPYRVEPRGRLADLTLDLKVKIEN
ncbi:MAG: alpha-L-rhamnosidase-related protein, partial [Bacteroidales bacterium]